VKYERAYALKYERAYAMKYERDYALKYERVKAKEVKMNEHFNILTNQKIISQFEQSSSWYHHFCLCNFYSGKSKRIVKFLDSNRVL
jgi:hypothetical protein